MKPEGPRLATKLFVPHLRPSRVLRPRLVTQLSQGLGAKLTLVSAPAGFGKTTLIADWLQQVERPFAWLSLDAGDNEPARFLAYLGTALEKIHDGWSQPIETALRAPRPPSPQIVMAALVNEVAASELGLVLALDDCHTIHEALSFLLEHLPPALHLVLVTRADPPLPLARLRARGHLSEIRAEDLRFTIDEAALFLRQVTGPNLTPMASWGPVTVPRPLPAPGTWACCPIIPDRPHTRTFRYDPDLQPLADPNCGKECYNGQQRTERSAENGQYLSALMVQGACA